MKNAVFWDIKTQFVPHRRHIMSLIQSHCDQGEKNWQAGSNVSSNLLSHAFHPDYGGGILENVGSHKSHTALHPRRQRPVHFLSSPCLHQLLLDRNSVLCFLILLVIVPSNWRIRHNIHYHESCFVFQYVTRLGAWAHYGMGYCMGVLFQMKYVVTYGLSCTVGRAEQIRTPNHPKCIGRIHLYSDMWRYFDQGLYFFLRKFVDSHLPFKDYCRTLLKHDKIMQDFINNAMDLTPSYLLFI
jgi:hypothetical protein